MTVAIVVLLLLGFAGQASAQVGGHISILVDVLPDLDPAAGNQHATELRARVFAERRDEFGEHIRVNIAGYVDGLVADRAVSGRSGATNDAIVRPSELYVELTTSRVDVRIGASRIVWGRLDEFQPTDVVNPIDITRFVLEGRSEARLAVGLVRGRLFLPGSSTIEAVVVPAFRASRFDQLDEASSPFNLARDVRRTDPAVVIPVRRDDPGFGASSVQGGARFTSTVRRVDWGVSAYRGRRAFPTVTFDAAAFRLLESFPRFTMIGGDFETVHGAWGVRGEVAVFPEDQLQSTRAATGVPGTSIEGGVGVDRRAGDYRLAANLILSRRAIDASNPLARPFDGDEEVERSDVSLVVAADRSFARETRTLRVLTVYDPADGTVFARLITAVSVRDNVWLEGSAGMFAGSSLDTIGRLTNRDFVYARLKVFF